MNDISRMTATVRPVTELNCTITNIENQILNLHTQTVIPLRIVKLSYNVDVLLIYTD